MQRLTILFIAGAALLAACAGPAPQMTTTSMQLPPGPDCSACLRENPGDVRPCVPICHRPESDLGGANAGGVIR